MVLDLIRLALSPRARWFVYTLGPYVTLVLHRPLYDSNYTNGMILMGA